MNSALATIFAFLLLTVTACAGPNALVSFPAGDASWNVEVSYSDTPQGDAIKSVSVTKNGRFQRMKTEELDGGKSESWSISDPPFTALRSSSDDVLLVDSNDSNLTQYLVQDFGENLFTWLRPDLQVSEVSYRGKPCLLYERMRVSHEKPRVDAETGEEIVPAPPVRERAWIDKNTLLPVAYQRGGLTAVFSFAAGPVETLTLPASIQKELDRHQKLNRPPTHKQRG